MLQDPDVQAVTESMQHDVLGARPSAVAEGVANLDPILWAEMESVAALHSVIGYAALC
jgi:hypothetical protein